MIGFQFYFGGSLEEEHEIEEKKREERRRQKEIPALLWLAETIKVDYRMLGNVLNQVRDEPDPYQIIMIRKRGRGKREICIPAEPLKRIQKKINRHILKDFLPASHVYGFSGGSIHDAIKPHLKAKSILCVDIKNAFPSVRAWQVMAILIEGREVLYGNSPCPDIRYTWRTPYHSQVVEFKPGYMSWYAARAITQLVTYKNKLPQGSPASPRIFDLICKPLDEKLLSLAQKTGTNYTRYADNIFFSMDQEEFPKPVRNAVLRRIRKEEFRPHKIRIRTMTEEAWRILGLNVMEGRVHNTRAFKKKLRISIHHVGWLLEHGQKGAPEFKEAWQKLQGQMNFARIDTLPPKLLNDYLGLEKQLN